MEQGADGMELDVWRCGSGQIVVFHDSDAERMAGSDHRITRSSWQELSRLDVGSRMGTAFAGERIPLLGEVLEALPSAYVNIELKSGGIGDPRLALGVARLLRDLRAEGRVIVSSFDYALLAGFRLVAPGVQVGLLFGAEGRWRARTELARRVLRPAALHPDRTLVTCDRVEAWRSQGYALNVWTVDAREEVERLCGLGVDALITNVPGETRQAVKRATGR
jgi:glycerophosphoryl diester phosphodiesterase